MKVRIDDGLKAKHGRVVQAQQLFILKPAPWDCREATPALSSLGDKRAHPQVQPLVIRALFSSLLTPVTP